jgi:3-hydroxymyristoyl/3-hydroxydecanoyl-(acyl carrier protein) dehydratase/acyl carrier protein
MSQPAPSEQTLQTIKRILRRDLKLGDEAELADDLPLIGGDLDLDSLDVLLLLTSLEKEFGFKVTSETIDRSAFVDLRTLALFIERRSAGAESLPSAAPADPDTLLEHLPHAEPFRFISALRQIRPGEEGEAVWRLSGEEAFFAGHFPNRPIVPGVLIAEALAQLSGLVAAGATATGAAMLASLDVRFRQAAVPPVEIVLRSRVNRTMGSLIQFDVQGTAGDRTLVEGTLTLTMTAVGG